MNDNKRHEKYEELSKFYSKDDLKVLNGNPHYDRSHDTFAWLLKYDKELRDFDAEKKRKNIRVVD
jgi:hypothetical protein